MKVRTQQKGRHSGRWYDVNASMYKCFYRTVLQPSKSQSSHQNRFCFNSRKLLRCARRCLWCEPAWQAHSLRGISLNQQPSKTWGHFRLALDLVPSREIVSQFFVNFILKLLLFTARIVRLYLRAYTGMLATANPSRSCTCHILVQVASIEGSERNRALVRPSCSFFRILHE